jgi:hypothetical protein
MSPVIYAPVQCEQLFSRKGISYLWDNRESLDKTTNEIIKTLWRSKKQGSMVCKQTVEYRHSLSRFGKMGYGRLFSRVGAGLERLEKEARGTLCKEFYYDIDIVNCHPVILVQYAKTKYQKDLPYLRDYVEHREEMLGKIAVDRDEAKEMVIKVLYGGKTDNYHLLPIANELQKFTKYLSEQEEHKDLFEECKKEDNRYASFLSHLLQTEEVACMMAMKSAFEKNGWSVDVLAYDGVMIRKRTDADLDEELLDAVQKAILTSTGYKVSVIEKEMMAFEIPAETEVKEDPLAAAYAAMKAKWEATHYYFRPNNVIVEQRSNGKLMSFSLEHATVAFNMWTLPDDPSKPRQPDQPNYFLSRWIKDNERRIIDDYVFKPIADCTKTEISLFKGFHYQTLAPCDNPKAVELFQDVLKAVCNDHEETYDYMLRWFARMIQDPFHKSGVCPIFINQGQGTGKDTVCLWIKKVMGNHVGHFQQDEQLFEKHDTQKEGAVMMYLEEVGSGVCKSKAEALKSMITSDTFSINPKCEKGYSVPNVGNFIMTTNKTDPVRIENTDRRFFPITGSKRLMGNTDYWDFLYSNAQLDQPKAADTWIYPVGKFLESLPLKGFNVRKLPANEYKNEIITMSEDPVETFLKQWGGSDALAVDLFTECENYCRENRLLFNCKGSMGFGKLLLRYRDLVGKRDSNGKTHYYKLH